MFRSLTILAVAFTAAALAIALRPSTTDAGYTITPSPQASRYLEPRSSEPLPSAPRVVLHSTTSEAPNEDAAAPDPTTTSFGDHAPASPDAPVAPGYLFDLVGLQDALATGLVPAHFDAATPLDPSMASRVIEATRAGFDAFLQIYNDRHNVESTTADARDGLEAIIDYADLVAAILPEARSLIQEKRIAIKVEFTATTAQTMLFSLHQPMGDLTVNILGHDTIIKLVIPHDVGPRALWRRIYERIERRGQLPRRFRPSSIEGAGTLSLEALKRGD